MAETERNHGGYNPNSQEHWFPPGTSGNPSGRKKGTVYVAEWMKMLSESKRRELEAIAVDEDASVSKRLAATTYLTGLTVDVRPRDRLEAVREVCDRTTGKAPQYQTVDIPQISDAVRVVEDIRRQLGAEDE
mgnify:FL=1